MPIRHVALALAVAVLWGLNFLAIHLSLEQFPPLFLVALRFALLAIPTLVLVPRPDVPLRWLIGYGLGFGTLQFFGLYLGMAAGFPAGLASLVLQSSAPFTVLLGALLLRERLSGRRMTGVAVAVAGLGVVGLARGGLDGWVPFLLVVLGGFGWALGNLASRQAKAERPMHLVLWMAVVPPLPMLALSLAVEGPAQIGDALAGAFTAEALPAWLGLLYTIVAGTVVGSGVWVWLMARHPASTVAPFSMLVPVVGFVAAWAWLGEVPLRGELVGGVLVVLGVLWANGRSLRRRDEVWATPSAASTPSGRRPAPSGPVLDDAAEPVSHTRTTARLIPARPRAGIRSGYGTEHQ
ncbi:EamA family transporter [Nesterenkonia sp. K-15-9-6]|uniref:EamA family transporter n=1 Tax=Nesterenkonia sp. K-15-9-6 TaxID=3093918 RepID=UPI0040439D76